MALPSWLSLSQTAGTGNATITISASSNEELYERVAALTITAVSYSKEVGLDITQSAATVTGITFSGLSWNSSKDISCSGGTADKSCCLYKVIAHRSGAADIDVTSYATVAGSLVVASSETYYRHSAGTLTLTATWNGKSCTGNVTVYQAAAPVPVLTAITLDTCVWSKDIPCTGGTANASNFTFSATGYYDNGKTEDLTDDVIFNCGTLSAANYTGTTRRSLGSVQTWVEYDGVVSNEIPVYGFQAAFVPVLTVDTSVFDFDSTGGTATFNITSNISWTIDQTS